MHTFLSRAFMYALVGSIAASALVVFSQLLSGVVLSLQEMVGGTEELAVTAAVMAVVGGIIAAGVQTWRETH